MYNACIKFRGLIFRVFIGKEIRGDFIFAFVVMTLTTVSLN